MFPACDYLDLAHTKHGILFPDDSPVWTSLTRIESYLEFRLQREIRVQVPPGAFIGEDVFIDEGTTLEPGVVIKGPAWIGRNCQLRGDHAAGARGLADSGSGGARHPPDGLLARHGW